MSRDELIALLNVPKDKEQNLFDLATKTKDQHIGNIVYLRGLIELSNVCNKNCFYCGIRRDNQTAHRYNLSDQEVIDAAMYAYHNRYGSVAIQSGEINSEVNTYRIERVVEQIKSQTNGELGITLSLGEQSWSTYKRWREAGADRYLLRIETSSRQLYSQIHPNDALHSYERRLDALYALKQCGYQLGSGVMIGLPWQSIEHLADDLLFFRELDIDMCGMGPYLEHPESKIPASSMSLEERFDMTLRMIAILRIMMPDINIASTTALQAIDPMGREKALKIGANVIMPNITPLTVRKNYKLYDNKPVSEDCLDIQERTLFERIYDTGLDIKFGVQGNSLHYKK